MDTKVCFKCGRELPLSFFYKHPRMADGRLNKCKDCTRKDVSENIAKKSENIEWRRKERARGREKYRRLGYKSSSSSHKETKDVARYFRSRGVCLAGCEYHHWNYNHIYDVIVMPIGLHRKLHNLLKFDQESKCFFYNGELLTSRQEHIDLIKSIS